MHTYIGPTCIHTHLIFVGGIERNLADFWVVSTKTDDVADGQFDALEQRRFGRITVAFSVQATCSRKTNYKWHIHRVL